MNRTLMVAGVLLLAQAGIGGAQEAATRAQQIEAERQEKAKKLEPDANTKAEDRLIWFKDNKVLERFSAGFGGLRVKLGGLATFGGFAFGPEYFRGDLKDGNVVVRAAGQISTRAFSKLDSELTLPKLAGGRVIVSLYGVHHRYPRLDYYGPGPDSRKDFRAAFLLEDLAFDGFAGVKPWKPLLIGGTIGYVRNHVGRSTNRDQFAAAKDVYSEEAVPGMQVQSDFRTYSGVASINYLDNPGGPRSGGNYSFQFMRYMDQTRGRFDFDKTSIELQQYIPITNRRRVIALRGAATMTQPRGNGQVVPFYMQPNIGGSESLRGFRPYRFWDNNAIVVNGEYHWEIFSGLDMALFADAGKVTRRRSDVNFRNLESSVGFGFRFNARNNVMMRIDVGFSHEGFQLYWKFNRVFLRGFSRTSSSFGDF